MAQFLLPPLCQGPSLSIVDAARGQHSAGGTPGLILGMSEGIALFINAVITFFYDGQKSDTTRITSDEFSSTCFECCYSSGIELKVRFYNTPPYVIKLSSSMLPRGGGIKNQKRKYPRQHLYGATDYKSGRF